MAKKKPVYRVQFHNQGNVYELFARHVSHGEMYGFVEIAGNLASFQITADKKILVAQYMEGQEAGGGTGDPAMALAVPVEQYRVEYQFHAPVNYETNYVNVTAPLGASMAS